MSTKHTELTDKPFPLPGRALFFGDYIDLDICGKMVRPIFTTVDPFGNSSIRTALMDTDGRIAGEREKVVTSWVVRDNSVTILTKNLYAYHIRVTSWDGLFRRHRQRKKLNVLMSFPDSMTRQYWDHTFPIRTGRKTRIKYRYNSVLNDMNQRLKGRVRVIYKSDPLSTYAH